MPSQDTSSPLPAPIQAEPQPLLNDLPAEAATISSTSVWLTAVVLLAVTTLIVSGCNPPTAIAIVATAGAVAAELRNRLR